MPVNRGQGQPPRWYRLCFVPISADSSDDSDTESVVLAHTSTPTSSTWEELSPPEPPVPEPEIDWRLPLPPPPPPPLLFPPSPPLPPLPRQQRFPPLVVLPSTSMPSTAALLGIESSQHDTYQSPSTIHSLVDHNPLGSFSLVEQVWPEAESVCPPQVPDGVMNAIRMVRISELHELDKPSQCPICMEEFKVGDQVCQLPCNHTYRSECILRWLNNNKTCPVCRLHLDGWEGGSDSRVDISLDPEPEIPSNSVTSNKCEVM